MSTARRASGAAPYWPAGTQIMWREGSGPLGTGPPVDDIAQPHFAQPVTVGVFSAVEAEVIEADTASVLHLVSEWGSPFRDGWENFRPDPAWPIPSTR